MWQRVELYRQKIIKMCSRIDLNKSQKILRLLTLVFDDKEAGLVSVEIEVEEIDMDNPIRIFDEMRRAEHAADLNSCIEREYQSASQTAAGIVGCKVIQCIHNSCRSQTASIDEGANLVLGVNAVKAYDLRIASNLETAVLVVGFFESLWVCLSNAYIGQGSIKVSNRCWHM